MRQAGERSECHCDHLESDLRPVLLPHLQFGLGVSEFSQENPQETGL